MDTEPKFQELSDYLLEVLASMEKERRRRMTYSDFAEIVDLPIRTVTSMFEGRKPIKANAEKVAVALNSNRIMRILNYDPIDPAELRFRHVYRGLDPKTKVAIQHQMEELLKKERVSLPV